MPLLLLTDPEMVEEKVSHKCFLAIMHLAAGCPGNCLVPWSRLVLTMYPIRLNAGICPLIWGQQQQKDKRYVLKLPTMNLFIRCTEILCFSMVLVFRVMNRVRMMTLL